MSPATESGTLEARLADAVTAFWDECRGSEPPDLEAFAGRYPGPLAEHLRQVLPALALLGPASAEHPPAAELGDFRLVREVGRGGMGVVYEAEQISLGRRVALKVLPFAATLDPTQLQRFRNEARAAAGLHHEHIVPVYAVGCERGVHYYAMQFIDGTTLAQLAPGPGRPRPDVRAAARLVREAADALDYAHRLGVVHRDVKPANLMVDAAGKLWVTDFGLARFGPDAGLTAPGDVLGTLRYMPPEQALVRHGLVDHRADVYGLGATLYELLTGRPAVAGTDRREVLDAIAAADPVPPRRIDRAVPAELETVCLKCLAKDPTERYATAGELADDLRRWLDDRPILARPPSLRKRAARWARRHRAAVVAAVAVLALGVVGSAVGSVLLVRAHDAEARQRQRADANWRRAFEALDRVCLRLAEERLPREARPTAADRALIAQLLAFYEDFVRENGSDPAVRYEAARACLRVGDLCRRLDRPAEAAEAYRQAVARARALAAEFPADPRYRRALAAGLDNLGLVEKNAGRLAEAEEAAREALAHRAELGDRKPLAGAYNLLGLVLAAAGRPADAEEAHRQALAVREELVKHTPGVRGNRNDLAASCVNLAVLRWKAGRLPEATEYARRALGLWEQLAKEAPREPFYRQWQAKCCEILCAVGPDDMREEGERLARRSVDLHKGLTAEFPGVPMHRHDLAAGWNRLGIHLAKGKRFADAAAAFREALAVLAKLAEEFPGRAGYRGNAGDTLVNLALTARDLGDAAEARRLWERAAGEFRAALDLDPSSQEYRGKLRRDLGPPAELPVVPPDG